MKLPIAFFDARNLGDILQRIRDHDRLRVFLTSSSIQTLFSLFNILVFGIVLVSFNFSLFIIFISGSVFYFIWILLFLKSRRIIDYKKFSEAAASQSNEVQLVQGMQEIKLNQAENAKRWEWEAIQARLFNISIKSLTIEQYQNAGGSFINELKNIVILFWSAQAVMKGEMTLGMMLAATQITGQLNAPIAQLIGFIQQAQDASISLERLGEIHQKENEDNEQFSIPQVSHYRADIGVENLSFRYFGAESPLVLSDVSFRVKYGKTTAIVGRSGSGKTTLLKLILKFYKPLSGKIKVGEVDLSGLDTAFWRKNCGTVMQDGYVFSDTILKNITISEEQPDMLKFKKALNIANITDFVDELPLNFNTKIGTSGIGLSQGQKQRIMIARAVYKNPDFLFFDEATSSLDAENEKVISDNLLEFAQGRTMVVIAHRLSTVKRADHIVVLERGRIVETGSHAELIGTKGHYYTLVRNQLELGE